MKARCSVAVLMALAVLFGSVQFATAADDQIAFAAPMFKTVKAAPAAASSPLKFAAPVMDCPNCTTCANGCQCFGGGYYCADGACPIQFGDSQPVQYRQVCENGQCRLVPVNSPTSGNYYLPASGGCASGNCGVSSYPATGFTAAGSYGGCASGSCGVSTGRRGLFGGGGLFGRRCR